MLQEIGSLENVDPFIADCLENKKKVMGIGHRVYKVLDPRALKLRKMVLKMGEHIAEPKWIQMSDKIAEIMLHEKAFTPTSISIRLAFTILWISLSICSRQFLQLPVLLVGPLMFWSRWQITA